MSKPTPEQRDKLIRVGVATAIVLGCIWLFGINALKLELSDVRMKIDPISMQWARFWTKKLWVDRTREELDATRKLLAAQEDAMAPTDKLKWFRNTLEGFVPRYGINVKNLSSEPQIGEVGLLPQFPYQAATFTVQAATQYQDLGRFLRDFENHFPYIRVVNLSIDLKNEGAAEGTRGGAPKLGVRMEMMTLVKPGVVP